MDDLEIVKTEILLADIDIIQKKLEKSKRKLLSAKEITLLENKLKSLSSGEENIIVSHEENNFLSSLGLLSVKPKIIVCNVDEQSVQNGNNYTKIFIAK